ncbi:MAG: hypothetical protein OXH08_05160 [Gammaproteobacteria bacterium]|nr:hypothetical protein [Gammaproteobacteria bacterium]
MNESEELFHRFAKARRWRVKRVDPHSLPLGSAAPDFRLRLADSTTIVVEVKQFDPNPKEQEEQRRLEAGEVVVQGTKPGKRLRKVVTKANKQLKALGGCKPGMLVVHNRTVNSQHDHSYSVLTAMRGLDETDVHVPTDPGAPPVFGPIRPGREKKMTAEMNRSVSCIGVLREFWSDSAQMTGDPEYVLDVYHNQFATHPLDPSRLVGCNVMHYRMNEDQTSWERHP